MRPPVAASSTWSGRPSALRPSSGSSRGSPPPCCALTSAQRRGQKCFKRSQRFCVPAHLARKITALMLYRSSSSSPWEDERGAEKAESEEAETGARQFTAGGPGEGAQPSGPGEGLDDPHRKDRQPKG